MMKRILCLILVAISLFGVFGCNNGYAPENAIKLSFKSASTYDYLKSIDGKAVTINGYMASSSPVDGSFMFLMNLPYQSCPFCVPNTSQLSNTMEVYPKKGDKFPYTTQAIKVVGKLEVSSSIDEYFTDEYGYQFNFKIVDAEYTVLSSDELSTNLALWQKIADSDVVNDIYSMYDYVNFLCDWSSYYINDFVDKNGNNQPGYYLHPSDAYYYLTTDGAQWNYGYKDGYFDNIINKIKAIDSESELSSLISNIENAKALATKAKEELIYAYNAVQLNDDNDASNNVEPNYTRTYGKLDKFDRYDYVYKLNKHDELMEHMDLIYSEFSNWLGSWEM